ncbi:LexA/Signal peptidase [Aaosphaeria arxii CBS 175.79]|uniref:Mitochondrial inner membrane protease subunit n=1 Tax=Aaosphaeria arxii CBS 175.79 TaxID=1450172 RepID=A0A6A5XNM1_9PLEO|nr:LexA/Signal peptidase [Aaosphaeria arxii CBS 175.79]KAF2014838.1 LexA/Signal peptidase [Aaosphaeria arxii CBS 175.79]
MPPPRITMSGFLSRFRPLRSGFQFPAIHKPHHSGRPNGHKELTMFGVLVRSAQGFLAFHIITRYFVGVQSTVGISMMPTIPHSYRSHPLILVSKLHRRGRNLKVGDIVVYAHPMVDKAQGAKRIVGMPGDYVSVVSPGKSGEDIEEAELVKSRIREELVRVPDGHCWLAGDNLEWSRDSRMFGPVPLALIKGKVLAVISPWSDRKWLRDSLTDSNFEEHEVVLQR